MSMQHRLQDQVVCADPWTLSCAECSQKMSVVMATPAQEGKEHAPTSASAVTAKGLTLPFIGGEPRPQRLRRFPYVTKDRP
jgi:hypothetical protein